MNLSDALIAVIGLGYVGLPLAVKFGKTRQVIGFDVNAARIAELHAGRDTTGEVEHADLSAAKHLVLAPDETALEDARVFIVAVPTPVDDAKRPDLTFIWRATKTVGRALKACAEAGATEQGVVIYESTVFPGCTRQVCVPVLERISGLRLDEDFIVGYSPERANPGDKLHRLTAIRARRMRHGSGGQATSASFTCRPQGVA